LPGIKQPFLDPPAIPSATTLTELVSSYYFKASRTFQNSSFEEYKILYKIKQYFLSYGSPLQILIKNNTEERKTFSHTTLEITIFRPKKE
jgi:hypothetical protein